MPMLFQSLLHIGNRLAGILSGIGDRWLLGLLARLGFAAVLVGYFWNSASTKIGEGLFGFLSVQDNAYYQIVPQAVDAAGGDVSALGFFPWGLIVHAGTYSEIMLPFLIVIGLFTRFAALGMIGFIIVQSLVDIFVHMVDPATIGSLFDRYSDGLILDQRTLWIVLLAVLVVKGAGFFSLDRLLFSPAAMARPA